MLRENIFKLLYAFGVPSILRIGKSNQLTILSLHRVSPERDFFFDPIDPIVFRKLLKYVQKHYKVISFQELEDISIIKSKKPLLILSFDDGYVDFYEYALPILTDFNFFQLKYWINENISSLFTIPIIILIIIEILTHKLGFISILSWKKNYKIIFYLIIIFSIIFLGQTKGGAFIYFQF